MKKIFGFFIAVCSIILLTAGLGHSEIVPYADGEILTYTIRKFGMKAGETVIEYKGLVDVDGMKQILITFTAKGFNFLDDERIFADPQTLLPLKVERNLNIFGKKERIVEHYNAQDNTVIIRKYNKNKFIEEIVFKKDKPIDNLYCYIFRYRTQGHFSEGQELRMSLPTKDVNFEIIRRETIEALAGQHEAWFMQSRPAEYQVWFSTGKERIPLRIDGAVGLAKTNMVLESYKKGKIE